MEIKYVTAFDTLTSEVTMYFFFNILLSFSITFTSAKIIFALHSEWPGSLH